MRLMWDNKVAYTKKIKKNKFNCNTWKGEATRENLEQIKAMGEATRENLEKIKATACDD
jgi:uncharacterized protein with HEPN domain